MENKNKKKGKKIVRREFNHALNRMVKIKHIEFIDVVPIIPYQNSSSITKGSKQYQD